MQYTLTIYDLTHERARLLSKTNLNIPKSDALKTLAVVRAGLPSNCGAALTDERLHNVAPMSKTVRRLLAWKDIPEYQLICRKLASRIISGEYDKV